MSTRRPLIIVDGQVQELPAGEVLPTILLEPVVVGGGNLDVVYEAGITPVPMFVTMSDGDIVTTGVDY